MPQFRVDIRRIPLTLALAVSLVTSARAVEPQPDPFPDSARVFLERHCFDCHGNGESEGNVDLQHAVSHLHDRAALDTWRKVMQQLSVGVMPPPDHEPQPAADEVSAFVADIDRRFFQVDCDTVHDPGRVTIRRLNRIEYRNTIQDLLGLDYQGTDEFPSDDVGYGFDNIGDVLTTSPLLLEKYLSAAEAISRQAIYTGARAALRDRTFSAHELQATASAAANLEDDYLLINKNGSAYAEVDVYVAGAYWLRTRAFGVQAGDEPVKMELRAGGNNVAEYQLTEDRNPQDYEVTLQFGQGELPLGRQRLEVAYVNDFNGDGDRDMAVLELELQGPRHLTDDQMPYPPLHRVLLPVMPDDSVSVSEAAAANLQQTAQRAFRRPVDPGELDHIVKVVALAAQQGESFEQAMRYGLQAILVSPHFLFRVERHAAPNDPHSTETLDQDELASRLSYFLWSTMPDEDLGRLAAEGALAQDDVLTNQVDRMLESPRSAALVQHFAGQWLNLRNLADVRPDLQRFPGFDDTLRNAMRRETELLFASILEENGSLLDLLWADYTFVNERLAAHYGIAGIEGEAFQRVSLSDLPRRGILTHAGILTLTSDPARTLPVKRGKWILETILGTPPPPPPPNVPPLEETAQGHPQATLREQLERHRQDARCAGCHRVMDPLGLAFEHYDAIGRWRDTEGDRGIDSSGQLPDGSQFADALELIELLRHRQNEYIEQVTRAMLTYALGRGLEPYDSCAVAKIVDHLANNEYQIRTLIHDITLSAPFQLRRGDGENQ